MNNKAITSDVQHIGLPLMCCHGPFYTAHLDKLYSVMHSSLAAHPRTAAFRFDLRLPSEYHYVNESRLIDRFIASLRSQIEHSRKKAKLANKYPHDTGIRYVWAREFTLDGRPHYHFVLFLNYDAINSFGLFEEGRDNLYNRIVKAWCSALDIKYFQQISGLLHVPDNAIYKLCRDDALSMVAFFYRASYLAKTKTKIDGSKHSFGGSRR
jgi:hypothetical protein